MRNTKILLAGAAAALVVAMGGAGAAEAGGKGFRFHRFHYYPHVRVYDSYGCGFYKRMWWKTGARYWKHKYYECIY